MGVSPLPVVDEKAGEAPSPPPTAAPVVVGAQLTVKPPGAKSPFDGKSSSETLSPCNEKGGPVSIDIAREDSNVSTPSSSAHEHRRGSPFDTDIEAMVPAPTNASNGGNSANCGGRKSLGGGAAGRSSCNAADAQVWFGQNDWARRHKERRLRTKSCACFARCSKRTRVMIQVAIVVLTVGAAVAIGLAISKAVGASIWQPHQM